MEYAGFWVRLAASLIDGFILSVASAFVLPIPNVWVRLAIGMLLVPAYHIYFWTSSGATPGKMAMGHKVCTVHGQPVRVGSALLRYLGYFLSTAALGIGYLMIAFTRRKRGLHDYMANTVVIRTRR